MIVAVAAAVQIMDYGRLAANVGGAADGGGGRRRMGGGWQAATLRECAMCKCQPHTICWRFLYIHSARGPSYRYVQSSSNTTSGTAVLPVCTMSCVRAEIFIICTMHGKKIVYVQSFHPILLAGLLH